MLPRIALEWLKEDGCVTVRPDGWFYISRPPKKEDLARFVAAIESLGSWSIETEFGEAKVRVTTGGEDARDGLMFKIVG